MKSSRRRDDSAPATVRRELRWAFVLALAGAAWFVFANWTESTAAPAWIVLAPLSAVAAYREPRLGCLLPFAIWIGATATYLAFFLDAQWPLGVWTLLGFLAPCFFAALIAQLISRSRRRRVEQRERATVPRRVIR
jgi:hypothetical protein